MPQISVIVPVYNVEKYIHRCVDSILAQTFTDFELILVDDGSPDNCGAICDEYAAKDSRVIVIHQQNGGLSAARNTGIDFSKGEYLSFVDSDDYVYPRYLEVLYHNLITHTADVSIGRMIPFYGDSPPQSPVESQVYVCDRHTVCAMLCDYRKAIGIVEACGKLYNKKLFCAVRFPVGRVHEDQFVAHKIMYASERIAITEEPLYGYFQNPDGITKSFSVQRYDNVLALKEAERFYLENREYELAEKAKRLMRLMAAFYTISAIKNRIYCNVPREYKMGIVEASREIRHQMGYDYYEWYLAQYSQRLVRIQAIIRKSIVTIFGIFRKKDAKVFKE